MVYYEPPIRKAGPHAANLAHLPEELVLKVLHEVDNQTVTSLRLTNSNFVGVCNDTLAKRLPTLHIHPTNSSLKQALEICSHPIFSQTIKEVALLGSVLWHEIEQTFPQIRSPLGAYEISAASVKGQFCPWPREPYLEKGLPIEAVAKEADFAVHYEQLIKAVTGLPRLHMLSFKQSSRHDAWNQTTQKAIDGHAKRCAGPPAANAQQLQNSDADVLFNLLDVLGSRITSLRLDTKIPFSGPTAQALRDISSIPKISQEPLRLAGITSLTNLNLVLRIGAMNEEHTLERVLIACAAPVLQHLKLTLVPQHARSQAAAAYYDLALLSIESILTFGGERGTTSRSMYAYFPHLETLILDYQDPPTPAKCKDPRRRIRPSCQLLDFSSLLYHTRDTLRKVSINNIIFSTPKLLGSPGNPPDTNLAIHKALIENFGSNYPNLQQFSWRINHFHHDPRCRSAGGKVNHRDCNKLFCAWYLPLCTLNMFEDAVDVVGAEFESMEGLDGAEEGFGYWDFGKAGLKARRMALSEGQRLAKVIVETGK